MVIWKNSARYITRGPKNTSKIASKLKYNLSSNTHKLELEMLSQKTHGSLYI